MMSEEFQKEEEEEVKAEPGTAILPFPTTEAEKDEQLLKEEGDPSSPLALSQARSPQPVAPLQDGSELQGEETVQERMPGDAVWNASYIGLGERDGEDGHNEKVKNEGLNPMPPGGVSPDQQQLVEHYNGSAEKQVDAAEQTTFHEETNGIDDVRHDDPEAAGNQIRKAPQNTKEAEKLLQCQDCDFTGTTISTLNRHRRVKHEGVRYPCEFCDYSATRRSDVKRHMSTKHEEYREDEDEDGGNDADWTMEEEGLDQNCEDGLPFEVKKENKETVVDDGLRMKQEIIMDAAVVGGKEGDITLPMIQPDLDGMYHCTECDYVGTDLITLNQHWKARHIEISYDCPVCPFTGPSKLDIKLHYVDKHHGLRFQCGYCDFNAPNPNTVKNHRLAVHVAGIGQLAAEEAARYAGGVKTEVKKEKREYREYDPEDLETLAEFQEFMRKNRKQSSKAASRGQSAKRGQGAKRGRPRINAAADTDGLFHCEDCDFVGTQKSTLYRHRKTKHDGVRYPCDQCDFMATRKADVKRHKQTKHKARDESGEEEEEEGPDDNWVPKSETKSKRGRKRGRPRKISISEEEDSDAPKMEDLNGYEEANGNLDDLDDLPKQELDETAEMNGEGEDLEVEAKRPKLEQQDHEQAEEYPAEEF